MYLVTLFVLYRVVFVANADLCDTVNIKYTIGKTTPIIDVQAEEISRMSTSCYKEVSIPGARNTTFHVEDAQFGFNKAYEYNGLIGTGQKPIYDTISVHFGNCSTMTQGLAVTTGLISDFTSDILCLHIIPEVDYRSLGTHVAGRRIRLNIRINTAVCPTTFITNDIKGRKCQPLCNGSGNLLNCKTVTTIQSVMSSRKPSKSLVTTTSTKPSFTSEVKTPKYIKQQTSTLNYLQTSTLSPSQLTKTISATSVTSATIQDFSLTSMILQSQSSTVTTQAATTLTSSTTTVPSSGYPPKPNTTTVMAAHTYPKFTEPSGHTTDYGSSTTVVSTSTAESNTTPSMEENSHVADEKPNFGLLEGLYVIAGCIVTLLLLGITAFLVRKRTRYASSGGSNMVSVPRGGLHWRDNWLVRYHNNEIEGDSFSQPDSEIQYIHSSFLNHSNTEYPEMIPYKQSENPYDNPWHLVRLDSDFVRNTKNIEGEKGIADSGNNHVDGQGPEDLSIHAHLSNRSETTALENENCPNKREIVNGNEKTPQNKHQFQKHFGFPIPVKGKYDIAKVKRSNSKNSFRTERTLSEKRAHLKQNNSKRTKSESHLTSAESKVKGRTRKVTSSSLCSDDSPTFEEVLKEEIHNIEDAFDLNSNIDIESNGSDRTNGSDVRRNWKVSTLYAIVSSRNGTSSQDIVVSRNSSHKRENSDIHPLESYRQIRERENMTKQILRSASRKESLCKEKSCSQRKCKDGVELPEVPSPGLGNKTGSTNNKTGPTNEKIIDHTLNEASSCDRSFLKNISPTANTKLKTTDDSSRRSTKSNDFEGSNDELSATGNVQDTLNTFLQNREMFEQNGSIQQHNSGASGTGQFPK